MNLEQLYEQAQHLIAQDKHNEAYKILKKLDSAVPNHPGILYLLGICQSKAGNKENAIRTYRQVLGLMPTFVEAMNNLGVDLRSTGNPSEAIPYFANAINNRPDFIDAGINMAGALMDIQRLEEASDILIRLLQQHPSHPAVLCNLGRAHLLAGNAQAALEHFQQAYNLLPDDSDISAGLVEAFTQLNLYRELIEFINSLAKKKPHSIQHLGRLWDAYLRIFDWPKAEEIKHRILSLPADELHRAGPSSLAIISTISSASDQLRLIRGFVGPNESHPNTHITRQTHQKPRIGFMSHDFKNHPVSYLTYGLFCHYNRDMFDFVGIATDTHPPIGNFYREGIREACCEFHECGSLTDKELISLIRGLELDVLIDLSGDTAKSRISVMRSRLAPVQMTYLGYPATSGTNYIDYTIGDPVLTPADLLVHFSEKLIVLPECFQANDNQKTISHFSSRLEAGLPAEGFVFCCFNQHIKITSEIFHSWLRILKRTPGSVLWLAPTNYSDVLEQLAEKSGISSNRLVFASAIPYSQHLGRYDLVDLALDTFPFNGGATTSDALWGGAPVLTLCGTPYASRMSSSLLRSVELDKLKTETLEEYEQLACDLAHDKQRLTALRTKLAANKLRAPAFDTVRFARHFERGLLMAIDRQRAGLKAEHIYVPLISEQSHNLQ